MAAPFLRRRKREQPISLALSREPPRGRPVPIGRPGSRRTTWTPCPRPQERIRIMQERKSVLDVDLFPQYHCGGIEQSQAVVGGSGSAQRVGYQDPVGSSVQ